MGATTLQDPTTHPMVLATHDLLAAMQEEFRIRRNDATEDAARWNLVLEAVSDLARTVKSHRDAAATDQTFYEDMVARLNKAAAALAPGEH